MSKYSFRYDREHQGWWILNQHQVAIGYYDRYQDMLDGIKKQEQWDLLTDGRPDFETHEYVSDVKGSNLEKIIQTFQDDGWTILEVKWEQTHLGVGKRWKAFFRRAKQ